MSPLYLTTPESDKKPIRRKIPLKGPPAHGRRGGLGTAGKHTKGGSSPHCIDACLPAAEAVLELSWEWRLEPAAATGLARSCLFSVLEEPAGEAPHKSIAWRRQRWYPRNEPAPSSPLSPCHLSVPPGQAHSTCWCLRTTVMFKIKLEALKMTA